jgi:hypothetical protein
LALAGVQVRPRRLFRPLLLQGTARRLSRTPVQKGPELQKEVRHDDRWNEEIPGLQKKDGEEKQKLIISSKTPSDYDIFG